MYCLRCGRETPDSKVFCNNCLDSMEDYPVKPGQPIVLPNRSVPQPVKKSRRAKPMNNEELLDSLRRQLKLAGRLWFVTLLLLMTAVLLLLLQWQYGLFLPA